MHEGKVQCPSCDAGVTHAALVKTDTSAGDTRFSMTALARSFPTLRPFDFEGQWNAESFDLYDWDSKGAAAQHAARFVLAVWSGKAVHFADYGEDSCPWETGAFDAMEALKCWDIRHRGAFLAWARDPWWPQ
jgi:hypothetical protein